jgi:hypothetical protein
VQISLCAFDASERRISVSVELALALELERRTQVLPQEVARWKRLTAANVTGLGIHRSQIEAVTEMLEALLTRQRQLLASLDNHVGTKDFPARRLELERELSGSHGIMAIFQHILAQRQGDSTYRDALDAADLLAADCYKKCIDRARGWDVLDAGQQLREPPLTYLNAALSPTAATRRHQLGLFGLPGEGISDLKMPVSVLSLPFDYTAAIWTYCALYHEVGHPLDQDLKIAEALEASVQKVVPAARWMQWRTWLREMVADVFGIMLGGIAYSRSLASLLIRPRADVTRLDTRDKHPNAYVRMFLVAEMLRCFKDQVPEMEAVATELEALWNERYPAAGELAPYLGDCPAVVKTLIHTKLEALKGHALREFADTLAADHAAMVKLASWLQTNFKRPEARNYSVRLVPGATQLALAAATPAEAVSYAAIHKRAGEFIKAIPRPRFLAAGAGQPDAARRQFFRDLTAQIRFDVEEEPEGAFA